MANTKAAQKEARKNIKRRIANLNRKTALKSAIKRVLTAIETKEEASKIKELLRDAQAQCARAKNKDLIHPNTAARKIGRLAKRVAQLEK